MSAAHFTALHAISGTPHLSGNASRTCNNKNGLIRPFAYQQRLQCKVNFCTGSKCGKGLASPRHQRSVLLESTSIGRGVDAEQALLNAISGVKGRGSQDLTLQRKEEFDAAVAQLEEEAGVTAPTSNPGLNGRWRLLFTSKPGTNSPVQRTFTSVDAFSIFQDVSLDAEGLPLIVNVVEFGQWGVLRVEAEANTDSRALPGFTPRKGPGLAIFGKSSTYPPSGKDIRVDFQFSKGAFQFKSLPFTIPYPVPFKAFGDETKGFIDVTYMSSSSDGIRLSRGNKGTLFVLKKEGPVPPNDEWRTRERL